jgi:hypothetical protein
MSAMASAAPAASAKEASRKAARPATAALECVGGRRDGARCARGGEVSSTRENRLIMVPSSKFEKKFTSRRRRRS